MERSGSLCCARRSRDSTRRGPARAPARGARTPPPGSASGAPRRAAAPSGIPERVGHGERARDPDLPRDLRERRDGRRRDSPPFQLRGDQTHGLMAERSERDEERDVDAVGFQQRRGLRGGLLHEAARRRDRAHERERPRREAPDRARRLHLAQPVEREAEVAVGVEAGLVERVRLVRDAERRRRRRPAESRGTSRRRPFSPRRRAPGRARRRAPVVTSATRASPSGSARPRERERIDRPVPVRRHEEAVLQREIGERRHEASIPRGRKPARGRRVGRS